LECGSLLPLWPWPKTVACEQGRLGPTACSARPKRWQATALQDAGSLRANYVIHAVGPMWRGGTQGEAHGLRCLTAWLVL
jgi:hypothetical protein